MMMSTPVERVLLDFATEGVAVRALSSTFGVELTGLRLEEPASAALVERLVTLLGTRLIVLIRGVEMSEARQDALTRALGALRDQALHAWAPPADPDAAVGRDGVLGPLHLLNKGNLLLFVNGPELCTGDPTAAYSEEEAELRGGTSCWHTGDTEKENVEVINILHPVIVPERGGQTLFLDTTAAFADLDPTTQAALEGLRVQHFTHFPPSTPEFRMPDPTWPVNQPLVKQHPLTGARYLYLNFNDMDRVIGLSRAESGALIRRLYDHVVQSRYVYAHTWTEGDLILWNCNGTLHKRGVLDPSCKRALRRTQTAVPTLQSVREWDHTRQVERHDGESWHPYPFQR